jgi:ribonuclease P protein component
VDDDAGFGGDVGEVGAGVDAGSTVLVGFVVSKAVGNAVTRNRVKRRLRALTATRVTDLPVGSRTVVRANPAAAEASFGRLGEDLDSALRTLQRRSGVSSTR